MDTMFADRPTMDQTQEAPRTSNLEPLETVAFQVEARIKKGSDYYLSAGKMLLDLRERLKTERPNETWPMFCATHFPQHATRTLYRYMSLARGEIKHVADGLDNIDPKMAADAMKWRQHQETKGNSETRKAQNAKASAKCRAAAAEERVANGGKAPRPKMDKETAEQYQRLAMLAKVLDAGQLQIINEIIEERWPGTEDKAKKAKAARDAA